MIETLYNIYVIACLSYIGYAVAYEFVMTFEYVSKSQVCLDDFVEAVKEYLDVVPHEVGESTQKTPKHSFFLGALFNAIERLLGINEEDEDDPVVPENPEIPFVEKYLKEFKSMPDPEEELSTEKLQSLKNNILMEQTPLGNVIMYYDGDKESFVYYSDLNIPYRYLEVVGRKYVITFQCKQLFLDMAEVLKEAEAKKQVKKEELIQPTILSDDIVKKKNVFAKFKSYNTDNSMSVVTESTPKKNAVSIKQKVDENAILKEKVNRYTHYGKMSNFSFLKKAIKNASKITFAEFKRRHGYKIVIEESVERQKTQTPEEKEMKDSLHEEEKETEKKNPVQEEMKQEEPRDLIVSEIDLQG